MRNGLIIAMVLLFGVKEAKADTMRQYQDKVDVCQAMLRDKGEYLDAKLHEMHMASMGANPNGWITEDVMYKLEQAINYHMYRFQNAYNNTANQEPEVCRQHVEAYVHWIEDAVRKVEALR